jgi:predicted Zn-dependent peptidase
MNMAIDWVSGPGINEITSLNIKEPLQYKLDNGIEVYEIIGSNQPLVKVDLVFKGARLLETKKLTARFTAALMRESTQSNSSEYIAEAIDYCGANIRSASNMDYNYLTFSCLNKHLKVIIPIIAEMVIEPIFEENEINKYRKKSIENLKLDLAKNELICYREFTSAIYGDEHPYGYNTTENDLLAVTKEDIINQYNRSITSENCFIIASGSPTNELKKLLNQYLGNFKRSFKPPIWEEPSLKYGNSRFNFVSKNELQTSINIGKRLFNRSHPDYTGIFLLNTILGGYFGSRLMTSIREQKGYTYNIYSSIDHLVYDGYFYISTEVDHMYVNDTIETIYEEIGKLQKAKVGLVELKMVKNYLAGNFLNLVDGPFLLSSLVRSLLAENLTLLDFKMFYEEIQTLDSGSLQKLAHKYLNREDMVEVVVGRI